MNSRKQISRLGIVNAYLVAEEEGLTLIDTMLPGSAKPILAAAEEAGAPIVRILLTHAHGDHIGSLDKLRAELPEAEVTISGRDARLLAKDKTLDPGEPQVKLRGYFPGAKTKPERLISAGHRVGSLEAVAAPGHTPGQLAFLDTRDRSLVCGDAYLALGGLFVTTEPVLRFPIPALLGTWHKPTAYATAQKLRALEPSRLATGHGPVLEAPAAEMDRALARAPRS